jgi:predicted dehydrogenase
MSATLMFVTGARPAASYVRVYGTAGWIEVDYEARATRLRAASALPSLVTKVLAPWTSIRESAGTLARNAVCLLRGNLQYFAGLQQLVRVFYEAVVQHAHSPIDPGDIHRVSLLMDDVISALDSGREIACERARRVPA